MNFNEDRLAVVIEMTFSADGALQDTDIYPTRVHNHAKLVYDDVAPWLEGKATAPQAVEAVPGLARIFSCRIELRKSCVVATGVRRVVA